MTIKREQRNPTSQMVENRGSMTETINCSNHALLQCISLLTGWRMNRVLELRWSDLYR